MSEAERDKRGRTVELAETMEGRESTDEPSGERPGHSLRTLARGVLLVALGVSSHLWIDARQADVRSAARQATGSVTAGASDALRVPVPDTVIDTAPATDAPGFGTVEVAADADEDVLPAVETMTPPRRERGLPYAVGTSGVSGRSAADTRDVLREPEPPVAEDDALRGSRATASSEVEGAGNSTWPVAADVSPVLGDTHRTRSAIAAVGVAPLDAGLPSRAGAARDAVQPPPAATPSIDADEESIRLVLERYQRAFNDLDVRAASRVWPDVDRRALERAFSHLEAQSISLQDCGVTLASTAAHARCRGVATYVPKVGRGPMRYTRDWNFTLARTDSDWRIQSVH